MATNGAIYDWTYIALINQASTVAPTSNILLYNTSKSPVWAPIVPVWTRVSAGKYKLSITGGFNLSKTFVHFPLNASIYIPPNYVVLSWDTDNNLLIQTYGADLVPTDSILTNFVLKIEIFH